MSTTLTALAVVAVGYILAYVVFDKLRDKFGYVGGAEYVLIGVLLGPGVSGFMGADTVRDLTPIVSLALGWMGMVLGIHFRLPVMALLNPRHVSIAFTEATTTFTIALALLLVIFHYVAAYPWATAAIPAVTLAAVATVAAPAVIDAFARKGLGTSTAFPVLQLTARIDGLVGVVTFGLVLAVFHAGDVAPTVRPPTATEWAVINVAVGVVSGVLFHLFLGPREDPTSEESNARLFVALAGAIVIASGAAYYLNLSPIFTNLILAFVLANTGNAHRDVGRLLAATERPVYLALLIFAGAAWRPQASELLFIAPAFVAIRLLARVGGGWVAGVVGVPEGQKNPALGRGLLSLGGTGVAIAVNYGQVHPDVEPNTILTATLVTVLLFETVATGETTAVLRAWLPPKEREREREKEQGGGDGGGGGGGIPAPPPVPREGSA